MTVAQSEPRTSAALQRQAGAFASLWGQADEEGGAAPAPVAPPSRPQPTRPDGKTRPTNAVPSTPAAPLADLAASRAPLAGPSDALQATAKPPTPANPQNAPETSARPARADTKPARPDATTPDTTADATAPAQSIAASMIAVPAIAPRVESAVASNTADPNPCMTAKGVARPVSSTAADSSQPDGDPALSNAASSSSTTVAPTSADAPKLAVVAQSTHFAPVAALSPSQQLATAVVSAIGEAPAAAPGPDETASGVASAATPVETSIPIPTLRTLDVQLEPEGLGRISISLRLSGANLSLELDASDSAAGDVIDRDKGTLVAALEGSGYAVGSITVHAVGAGTDATGSQTGSMAEQGQPDTNSSSSGFAQDGTGNRHEQTIDPSARGLAPAAAASLPLSPGRGGDLYV
jgi:flagellar hook-length control protein FliK